MKEFTNETILVFAEFVRSPKTGMTYLVCIDIRMKVLVYDIADLHRPKLELTEEEAD